MIAATKGIAPQRSLLVVGAQILQILDHPMTISQTWTRLREWRATNGYHAPVPFWWFVLSLDVLYALGVIELDRELLSRRRADVASAGGR
ncbi:ABC-three component system middle component 6 [Frankia sp. CiP3]|uniref:ABC-three component system middle component 6 n=1 Tax=Frankia sp. CiP3 TaxID=2880971 RepID=UPI001EF4603F|nr:ABC-three component system middle component 6 [Frankia sp. CiP3]